MAVHPALLEIGVRHELRRHDPDAGAQQESDCLRLDPNRAVPTPIVAGRPVGQCAALPMLRAERHPAAGLAPPPGDEAAMDGPSRRHAAAGIPQAALPAGLRACRTRASGTFARMRIDACSTATLPRTDRT